MKWIFSGGVRYPVDDEARAFAAAEAAEKPAGKAEKAAEKAAGKPKPGVPAEIKAAPAPRPKVEKSFTGGGAAIDPSDF